MHAIVSRRHVDLVFAQTLVLHKISFRLILLHFPFNLADLLGFVVEIGENSVGLNVRLFFLGDEFQYSFLMASELNIIEVVAEQLSRVGRLYSFAHKCFSVEILTHPRDVHYLGNVLKPFFWFFLQDPVQEFF